MIDEGNCNGDGPSKSIRYALSKSGKPASVVATVGGFVSDVLQPLAPVGLYLAVIAAVMAIISGIMVKRSRGALCPSLFPFSAVAAVVLGVFSGVTSIWPERGALASALPAVGDLQDRLFKIQESVDRIETAVGGVSGKLDDVQASVGRIEQSIDVVGRSGALILSPKSLEEYWNNAKVYSKNGQYLDARKAYLKCIEFNPPFVDPYLDYAAILRAQDGYDAARRAMAALADSSASPAAVFASLSLLEGTEKQSRLVEFIERNPDFLPAYIELFHVLMNLLRDLEMESQSIVRERRENHGGADVADDDRWSLIEDKKKEAARVFVDSYQRFSRTPISRDDFMRFYIDKERIPLDEVWSLQTWKNSYQLYSAHLLDAQDI